MAERFIDEGHPIYEFVVQSIDVQCPQCGERAQLAPWGVEESGLHSSRRLACYSCGFTRAHDGEALSFYTDGRDPCFGYPLWYRVETSKGTIWAYHKAHLESLRAYVAADLRERSAEPTWSNRSYFSRLPRWLKSAKNRDQLLKKIDLLLEA